MGRLPADHTARLDVRVPVGNQGIWETIRGLHRSQQTFTVGDVDGRMNTKQQTIQDYVRRLTRAGVLEAVGHREGPTPVPVYRLVADQPEAPVVRRDGSFGRRPGIGQEQMWRSMKMLGEFAASDLALASSTDAVPVTVATAESYIRALQRTGYLVVSRVGKPGHKPGTGIKTLYRFKSSMNTGPLAPQIMKTEWVWDPNIKRAMGVTS